MTDIPEPISPDARRALEQELSDVRAERDAVTATLRDTDADLAGDSVTYDTPAGPSAAVVVAIGTPPGRS